MSEKKLNQEMTDEQLDTAIDSVLQSPEVAAALDNVSKDAKELAVIDDELQATLDKFLETPEVTAMLENVAADAADDAAKELTPAIQGYDPYSEAINRLETHLVAFEKRVAAAFKHAGFKF